MQSVFYTLCLVVKINKTFVNTINNIREVKW
jgi:hypothetical protein